jgi:exopolysaccharide production protein ExoQ
MPPEIALLVCFIFILFVFWLERKRNVQVSSALILPLIWYSITASRPIGVWLLIWGIPLPFGPADPTEGTTFDGWIYGLLTIIGLAVLIRRQFHWGKLVRQNSWIIILFLFMLLSILWSDYPAVSAKRVTKSMGAAIMALVVLSDSNPLEAIAAVIRRCAYFQIPLSIVVIRYFRNIGLNWNWAGDAVEWLGIATSKNTLGQVAAVSALCFLWQRMRWGQNKEGRMIDWLYILMSLYLLKGSDDALSMTSLSVFIVGLFVFFMLHFVRLYPQRVKPFSIIACTGIIGILLILIYHALSPFSKDSFLAGIVTTMGRDMTITGRTEIWNEVIQVGSRSPLLGVGFGAFWIGQLVNIPWSAKMTWTLGQAHNGYVDTYLQRGGVGLGLLLIVIISSAGKIVRTLHQNFEYGRIRMTFFLVILFVNITESTFLRGDHSMWFLFLITALSVIPKNEENGVSMGKEEAGDYVYDP